MLLFLIIVDNWRRKFSIYFSCCLVLMVFYMWNGFGLKPMRVTRVVPPSAETFLTASLVSDEKILRGLKSMSPWAALPAGEIKPHRYVFVFIFILYSSYDYMFTRCVFLWREWSCMCCMFPKISLIGGWIKCRLMLWARSYQQDLSGFLLTSLNLNTWGLVVSTLHIFESFYINSYLVHCKNRYS